MPVRTRSDRGSRRIVVVAVAVVAIGLGLSFLRVALDDHEPPPLGTDVAGGVELSDDVRDARETLAALVDEMDVLQAGEVDASEAERWAETARATTAALGDPVADAVSYRVVGQQDLLAARLAVHDAATLLGVAADTAALAAAAEPPRRDALLGNATATRDDAVALWDNGVIALQDEGLLGHEDMRLR